MKYATMKDRKSNMWTKRMAKIVDIVEKMMRIKCQWAGHVPTRMAKGITKMVSKRM